MSQQVAIPVGAKFKLVSVSSVAPTEEKQSPFWDAVKQAFSLKVFLIVLLIAILLIIFWLIIKPEKPVALALTAFPPTGPFIPSDNTTCGKTVILATDQGGGNFTCPNCDNSYAPYQVDRDIYYLGTKLELGKTYCLPQQDFSNLSGCGTYTGQAVWSLGSDGVERWYCHCKYPSLFGGESTATSTCSEQLACYAGTSSGTGLWGTLQHYNQDGTVDTGKTWDPIKFSPENSPTDSPYVTYLPTTVSPTGNITINSDTVTGLSSMNGIYSTYLISGPGILSGTTVKSVDTTSNSLTLSQNATVSTQNAVLIIRSPFTTPIPQYMCQCPDGYYRLPNDPYRCHPSICYAGYEPEGSAIFDQNLNQCLCDGSVVTKSNISGFCYPYDTPSDICLPNANLGTCSCGTTFIDTQDKAGFVVNYQGKYYLTFNHKTECNDPTSVIPVKVEITGNIQLTPILSQIFKVDNTLIDFTFSQFPTFQVTELCTDEQPLIDDWLTNSINKQLYLGSVFNGWITNNAKDPAVNGRIPIPCNSYFYSRPNAKYSSGNLIYCADFPESSDLNKTGIVCKNMCDNNSCGQASDNQNQCEVDVTDPKGFICHCDSLDGYKLSADGTTCQQCIAEGQNCGSNSECCSGDCRTDTVVAPGGHGPPVILPATCHSSGSSCVTGETLILMANLKEKRIDQVRPGDYVISGLTSQPTQVISVDLEYLGRRELVGIDSRPFATADHCFITTGSSGLTNYLKSDNRVAYDPKLSIENRHWSQIESLEEGMNVRLPFGKNHRVKKINLLKPRKQDEKTPVYDLITQDHSYVANGFACYDDFPEIQVYPTVAYFIYCLLLMIEEDREYLKNKKKWPTAEEKDLLALKPLVRRWSKEFFEKYQKSALEQTFEFISEYDLSDYQTFKQVEDFFIPQFYQILMRDKLLAKISSELWSKKLPTIVKKIERIDDEWR